MKLRDELIKNLTDNISYADGDGIIYCKSKQIGTWNNEANCDYPEDLTWYRDIGSLYRESFKAGAEHGFDACEAQYFPMLEKLESALKFYGDGDKYFSKEIEIDFNNVAFASKHNEETGESESVDTSKIGIFNTKSFDCSARLKVDRGNTAQQALAELAEFKNKMNRDEK